MLRRRIVCMVCANKHYLKGKTSNNSHFNKVTSVNSPKLAVQGLQETHRERLLLLETPHERLLVRDSKTPCERPLGRDSLQENPHGQRLLAERLFARDSFLARDSLQERLLARETHCKRLLLLPCKKLLARDSLPVCT